MKHYYLLGWLLLPLGALGQNVGIGTTSPASSAALDVSSITKGLLPPRLTQDQRDAIARPAVGLMLYNTTAGALNVWDGAQWQQYLTSQPAPSVSFTTPGTYSYTVPPGVRSLYARLDGAPGGAGGQGLTSGGRGGRVQGVLAVMPGQVLVVVVGGAGDQGTAGSNGGGQPGSNTGGGGGASDLRKSSGTLADRLLVAGGGGGGSDGGLAGASPYQDPYAFGNGGAGGGSYAGQAGGSEGYRSNVTYSGFPYRANGGEGGSLAGPGKGGTSNASGPNTSAPAGNAGDLGTGGPSNARGGAGGGGYYGGGSGGTMNYGLVVGGGGGGGGASFADASVTSSVVHTQGGSGAGAVALMPLAAPVLDGSNFVNLPGDNLGNHTATQALNLNGNSLTNAGSVTTPTTGSHNMLAVAYGSIGSTNPTPFTTSGNFSFSHAAGSGVYVITFTSANLSNANLGNMPVLVSLYGTAVPGLITWAGSTGTVTVYTYTAGGAAADHGFSFAVFLP